MKKHIRYILKLLFPPKCIFCGALVENHMFEVCDNCLIRLPYKTGRICTICSRSLNTSFGDDICSECKHTKRWFDSAISPFLYTGLVRSVLIKYKFYGKTQYAKTLAEFLFKELSHIPQNLTPEIITYIPLHPFRFCTRGYNQSKLIAQYLSQKSNIPLLKTLKKVKNTKPLSLQKHKNRIILVRNAFSFYSPSQKQIAGKHILLVDDIITTGSTLSECSKILKKSGAVRVTCACIATTPHV